MNRDTVVRTWREVCGNDTVMAMGVVTVRMLEEFAARIEATERERWSVLAAHVRCVEHAHRVGALEAANVRMMAQALDDVLVPNTELKDGQ